MVVEQLLRPEALQQLLTFLSESTIYHASLLGGRQLAASLAEGLSAPLIAQLAEELRAGFPSILGKHTLRDGWAFKYDNTLYDTATASAEGSYSAAARESCERGAGFSDRIFANAAECADKFQILAMCGGLVLGGIEGF